ncbi:thioredoxin-domain-containing protein [Epithele typhae]|uniref:thioredoxin-domain-containing protein n=1 Tax=Epithele typhae TaxID=378194 RepID=UPI002008DB54|nr:thioredoxin-domain-containing protein [Epithele typhae]KAH9930532.1 thioredoxin-domain-containing protein [Epithele typhae]
MTHPTQIESVSQWNTTLRAAKEKGQAIVVDFFATWCGPCKAIAPFYEQLAAQFPHGVFLKVDVDKLAPIAAKYSVTAMPTFVVITQAGVADSLRGADQRALHAMVARHAAAPEEGNKAFAAADYEAAADAYSRAIAAAPQAAVLYGNRAFAYIKRARAEGAVEDARAATVLDEKWGKGWVRMAEAALLAEEEEGMKAMNAALESLQKAVSVSDGKVKADVDVRISEAQKMLDTLKARSTSP